MFSHLWETRESLRETRESFLFTLFGSIVNNIDRIITKKEHNQNSSVFKALR